MRISEIPPEWIEAQAAFFPGPQLEMVVASIAAGNTAAQLWKLSQSGAPPILLLWDKGNNVFYLSGERIDEATRGELTRLVEEQIRPRALLERKVYFKARALSPATEVSLASLFAGIELVEMEALFYGINQTQVKAVPAPGIGGIRFAPIDRAFLTNESLENTRLIRSEIRWMWPSEERFYTHGFGCAAVLQERVICWCTAEYVSANRCGIGIQTEAAYQRRGVATATTARFIQYCGERGIQPYWECDTRNIPSVRVAEKAGFSRIAEERFWMGTFENHSG